MKRSVLSWCFAIAFSGLSLATNAQQASEAPYVITDIAFRDVSNRIFVLGTANKHGEGVYSCNSSGGWQFYPGMKGTDVGCSASGNNPAAVVTSSGSISIYINNKWAGVGGSATDVCGNPSSNGLFMLHKSTRIVNKLDNNGWKPISLPAKRAKSFGVGPSNEITIVDEGGVVWTQYGVNWKALSGVQARSVFVSRSNAIYAVSTQRSGTGYKIYWYDPSAKAWKSTRFVGTDIISDYGGKTKWTLDNGVLYKYSGSSRTSMNGTKSVTPPPPPPPNNTTQTGGGSTSTGGGSTATNGGSTSGGSTTGGGTTTGGGAGAGNPKANIDAPDATGNTTLHYAVRSANTSEIVRLLDNGANVNYQNNKGETPAFDAIYSRKSYIVKMLIDRGANINITNTRGRTMLHKAVELQDLAMVQMLLDNGADVNKSNPIQTAAEKNNIELTRLLIDRYANPAPALAAAANNNNTQMFRMLIEKGARLTDNKPFEAAVNKNNAEIIEMCLANGANPTTAMNYVISKNNTNLVLLCLDKGGDANKAATYGMQKNQPQVVTKALEKGAAVNNIIRWTIEKDQYDMLSSCLSQYGGDASQALKLAVELNKPNAVSIALGNGAQTNDVMVPVCTKGDKTTLEILLANGATADLGIESAINNGHKDIVEVLLNSGADANKGLDLAISKNNPSIVDLLLQRGADASPTSFIEKASGAGQDPIVTLLLNYGANAEAGLLPALKNKKSSTATLLINKGVDATKAEYISTAAYNGDVSNVELLLNKGARAEDGMNQAIVGGSAKVLDVLIRFGASVENEEYALNAVQYRHTSILKVLIEKGAPLTYTGTSGESLLHLAAKSGNTGTTQLLLANGLDVNAVDNLGNSPLHFAVVHKNNTALAEMLFGAGALPSQINNAGDTPLMIAKGGKLKKLIKANGGIKNKK